MNEQQKQRIEVIFNAIVHGLTGLVPYDDLEFNKSIDEVDGLIAALEPLFEQTAKANKLEGRKLEAQGWLKYAKSRHDPVMVGLMATRVEGITNSKEYKKYANRH